MPIDGLVGLPFPGDAEDDDIDLVPDMNSPVSESAESFSLPYSSFDEPISWSQGHTPPHLRTYDSDSPPLPASPLSAWSQRTYDRDSGSPPLPAPPFSFPASSQDNSPPHLRTYNSDGPPLPGSALPEPMWTPTHEAALLRVLRGREYAGGRGPRQFPLLNGFAPMFDLHYLVPLAGVSSEEYNRSARNFRSTCWSAAEAGRPGGMMRTPIEAEQEGLVGVMLLGIITLVRAVVANITGDGYPWRVGVG
ncbi:hypothetical protein FKP32DRAFT_1670609 [Trametes sanguinea]|nr:hypothetical protein FKP32DRAFT_1670609 [Trametes sanguinea]